MHGPFLFMIKPHHFILLLCIATAAAIYAVGAGDFFYFDSIPALALNKAISEPTFSVQNLIAGTFSFHNSSLSRPLTMLSFSIEAALTGGADARQVQFVNIVIHLFNGWLAYRALCGVLRRLHLSLAPNVVSTERLALLAAMLWLLNPLHVSTVLYSVQRMTLLATTFTLLGLIAYVHYRERLNQRGGLPNLCVAVLICTALATLCKENGILLPLLIALIELLSRGDKRHSAKEKFLYYCSAGLLWLPLFGVVFLPLLFSDFFAQWYASRDFSVAERLWSQGRIGWSYVLWFVMPLPRWLGLFHDDIPLSTGWFSPWSTAMSAIAWGMVIVVAVFLKKRWVLFSFGALFFLAAHLLESTLIPLEMVFEHRNYLPSIGLALIVAALIQHAEISFPPLEKSLAVVVLIAYASLLFLRTSFWSSEMLMAYTHNQFHPNSPRSLFHWANTNLVAGERAVDRKQRSEFFARADTLYQKLAELDPKSLVAPAGLLYLNEKYKGGADSQRWLSQLNSLAEKHVFSTSDYNALNQLADCTGYGWCSQSQDAIGELLLHMHRLRPESADFCSALAKFEMGRKNWSDAKRWALCAVKLESAIPNRYLLAAVGSAIDDQDLVYEQITLIQRTDRSGQQSHAVKELFHSGKLAL